eukprot:GILI01007393.1.p1 GENE.GILI01007393.1~~GILI01007393.1.p1  ORF type:complete len:310 (+),score=77.23 GILI01007393.1:57-932(+)
MVSREMILVRIMLICAQLNLKYVKLADLFDDSTPAVSSSASTHSSHTPSITLFSFFVSSRASSTTSSIASSPLLTAQPDSASVAPSSLSLPTAANTPVPAPSPVATSSSGPVTPAPLTPASTSAAQEARKILLIQVLSLDTSLAYSLATDLSISQDEIRREHARWLYEIGQDDLAEEILVQVEDLAHMGSQMLDVGHRRLAAAFKEIQQSQKFAPLLASIPADVFEEVVRGPSRPCIYQPPDLPQPPLEATKALFVRAGSFLPMQSDDGKRAKKLTDVASAVLRHLESLEM